MDIPMDSEVKSKLISETKDMERKAIESNRKLMNIITAANNKTIVIEGPGFDIEVRAAVPGTLRDKLIVTRDSVSEYTEYLEISESIRNIEAAFMAAMCVDPELKTVEGWIYFDEETGLLDELVNSVIGVTTATEQEVQNFRKKT